MKRYVALTLALPVLSQAHTLPTNDREGLRAHILEEFMQKAVPKKVKPVEAPVPKTQKSQSWSPGCRRLTCRRS